MQVVDRNPAADRRPANFSMTELSSEDVGRPEYEIMEDTITEIADSRGNRER